jgi:flagellar hook-associated protein 2
VATITSSTGASGLQIDTIVSGLMTIEQQPLTAIQTKISSYNTQLSAYGTLKSSLSTFQTAVDNLATASKFNAQSTTLSDSTSMAATADGTATNGSYSLAVSQLASSQKLTSASYANTTDAVGTGTMTISFGTYTAANSTSGTAASFTANSSKSSISINITSSNNTLAGIRDAINAQNASVSASIVNDGTGYRLVVTSKDTGEANSLQISVADSDGNNTDSSGLSALAYDPLGSSGSGQNMTQLVAAKDALLTVDGLNIKSASNTLTGVIQGVTLNLKTVTSATNTLTIGTDTTTIQASVQSFVDAYNKLNTTLKSLTKFVEAGSSSNGPLLGDSTARNVMVKLKAMLAQSSPTAGTYKTLSDIGVATGSDGSLSLDSTKLQTALTNNLSDVAKIFAPSATTTDPQVTYVSSTSSTVSGVYAINVSQLSSDSQSVTGTINGVAGYGSGSYLSGAGSDNSFGLKLNISGTATGSRGTVTFSRGLAGDMSSLLDGWLDTDGLVENKIDGVQTSIDGLQKQYDALNAKLPATEQRYRSQYAALDAMLSKMQTTSSYLTSLLSSSS